MQGERLIKFQKCVPVLTRDGVLGISAVTMLPAMVTPVGMLIVELLPEVRADIGAAGAPGAVGDREEPHFKS